MKAKAVALLMAGIMLAFFAGLTVAEENKDEKNKGADKIQLFGGKKGNIPFPHHKHQESLKDCNICHADFPQKAGSIEKLKAEGKLEKKQIMNKHCTACHKKMKREEKKTGPTTCSKCHQK